MWLREHAHHLEPLTGADRLLALADWIRVAGRPVAPAQLYHECVQAFVRREIEFDVVTSLYRHVMIHAGAIVRAGGERFEACPMCGARFADAA